MFLTSATGRLGRDELLEFMDAAMKNEDAQTDGN
jgi:hypothetical protein